MSARPRPVTATFPPPVYAEHPRPSYSLSPDSSIASLVSILDHGSCASFADDSPIVELGGTTWSGYDTAKLPSSSISSQFIRYIAWPQSRGVDETKGRDVRHNRQRAVSVPRQQPNVPVSSGALVDEEQNERHLSAWEKWILHKAKIERDVVEEKLQKQKVMEKEAENEEIEQKKRTSEATAKFQAWIDQYDASVKQKRRLQRKRDEAEQQLKEEKKLEELSKAKDKFEEWLEKKNIETTERAIRERERKQAEKLNKALKQEKSEAAFKAWCEKARNRPRTARNSYGYSAGQLKGYYDASAYPAPSYYNPIPWRSVEIAEQKTCKKKPVKNKVASEQ